MFQVKHWIDPQIIPFGWGLFSGDERVVVEEERVLPAQEEEEGPPLAMTGLLVRPAQLVGLLEGPGRGQGGQVDGQLAPVERLVIGGDGGEALADRLTAAVEIRVKKRVKRHGRVEEVGELAIHFGSLDELNGLIERLRAA